VGIIAVKPLTSLARGETVPFDRAGGLLMVMEPDPVPPGLVEEGLASSGTFWGGRTYATETARCFYCTEAFTGATRAVYWAGIPSDPTATGGTLMVLLHPARARRLAARLLRDAEDAEDAAR